MRPNILVFTEKSKFSILFFPLRGKLNFFPSDFSKILLGSARLMGRILGANLKMVYKWSS